MPYSRAFDKKVKFNFSKNVCFAQDNGIRKKCYISLCLRICFCHRLSLMMRYYFPVVNCVIVNIPNKYLAK